MRNQLLRLQKDLLKIIIEIGKEAQGRHARAYVVGGFVRDLILKKKNLDLDVVVEADAVSFARDFAKGRKAALTIYRDFKTATMLLPDGLRIDLATARKEVYPYPGALPIVQPASIRDDLFRRDFTINAMAIVINPEQFGELVDFFGGMTDLKNKKIRILHTQSFLDDPTRILRAVRFEQRFGFSIESDTLKLLKTALKADAVHNVKPPRYFEEFKKTLMEPQPEKALRRLAALKGFSRVGRDFVFDNSIVKFFMNARRHMAWLRRKLPAENFEDWIVYFMAFLERNPRKKIMKTLDSFQMRKTYKKNILQCKDVQRIARRLSANHLRAKDIYRLLKPLSYEMLIFIRTKSRKKNIRKRIDAFLFEYDSVKVFLKGDDLKRLGVEPGRRMGKILSELLDQKVEGRMRSMADELKYLKKYKVGIAKG